MSILLSVTQLALGYSFEATVDHMGQPTNYTCGATTAAMWANSVNACNCDDAWSAIDEIVAAGGSVDEDDGVSIPEFIDAVFEMTPYGYYFSEWEYKDKYATVKGIAYSIARFSEPAAIVGRGGQHWFLVRGVVASANPYSGYPTASISGLYLNDSKYGSPAYASSDYYFSPTAVYSPAALMRYVEKIPLFSLDRKYRSVERSRYYASHGLTYENNDSFSSY